MLHELDFSDFNTVIGSHQHASQRQILLCDNDVVNHFVRLRTSLLLYTTTTPFGFCLTGLFFRDHSKLRRAPGRSPKNLWGNCWCDIFYRLHALHVAQPTI